MQNDRAEKMALKRILNDLGQKLGISQTNLKGNIVLNPFDLTLLMNAPSLTKMTHPVTPDLLFEKKFTK